LHSQQYTKLHRVTVCVQYPTCFCIAPYNKAATVIVIELFLAIKQVTLCSVGLTRESLITI